MRDQAQDVGVIKHLMHFHLCLSLLSAFAVMAQDPLQGVEAPVLCPLYQIDITEPTEERTQGLGNSVLILTVIP